MQFAKPEVLHTTTLTASGLTLEELLDLEAVIKAGMDAWRHLPEKSTRSDIELANHRIETGQEFLDGVLRARQILMDAAAPIN